MLQKLFQKIKKGMLCNLFCEASITLIPKLEKTLEMKEERGKRERKEVTSQYIPHEHKCKMYNKILANKIWQYIKRIIQHNLWDLSQECKAGLIFENQCNSQKKGGKKTLSQVFF